MGKKKQRKKFLQERRQIIRGGNKNNVAIMVGMPIHHYVDNFTLMCLDSSRAYLNDRGIIFDRVSTTGIPDVGKARNEIVEIFLEDKKYTHLMWIDSDMVWNPPAVEALINLKTPVSSCLVTKKAPPFNVTIFTLMRPDEHTNSLDTYNVPLGQYPLDEPFEYPNSGIGTAFMLIEREVIEKMGPPYFGGMADPVTKTLKGTDFYFCVQVLKNGYHFVYDPRPNVYHVGKCLFGVEDHVAFLDQRAEEGIEECQFMSLGAESVEDWKRSFAGPQLSLKAKVATIVAEQQKESSVLPEESKSVISSCPSSEKDDPMKTQIKTGLDVAKLPKPVELIKTPTHQEKSLTKSVSGDGQ